MCQGRSVISPRRICDAISCWECELGRSDLFAKKSIGSCRLRMSARKSNQFISQFHYLLTFVLKEHLKFVLRNCEAQVIGSINNENYCFTLLVIVLPKRAVTPLTRHIEDCEVDLVFLEGFHLKTHCCRQFLLLVLLWLQPVYHSWLAWIVEAHYNNLRLFISNVPHFFKISNHQ